VNVCLLNGGFDTWLTSAEQLLARYWHVPRLAEALAEQGHQVTVIQAFHRSESVRFANATIEFVEVHHDRDDQWAEIKQFADVASKLESKGPEVVHVFGLTLLPLCLAVGRWCTQHGVGATASFHGGRPGRNPLTWWRQRKALAAFSAFFFSNSASADQWRRAKLIPNGAEFIVVPEVSSPFTPMPKRAARETLQIDGEPLFVWAGRLHPMKDPLTTLRGFRGIVRSWPNARLVMVYQTEELLNEIKAFLARDEFLEQKVTMLGALEHKEMKSLFSAADFFVHSSRREHGSNVLIEALSCGAIPVVSNIPSLNALTESIDSAVLFDVGDADALTNGVLKFRLDDIGRLSEQVTSSFDAHLSYPALAARYTDTFERTIGGRRAGTQI